MHPNPLDPAHPGAALARAPRPTLRPGERGQSTAEYALVLLGAATVALIFIAWASRTERIAELFDVVIDTVIGRL